jgi:hypothetical protein
MSNVRLLAFMRETPLLETFWFSFPKDAHLPLGVGVTAYSESDARTLLHERGVSAWFADAQHVTVTQGVRAADLDQTNVVPNIGPMQLRGVWYPCMNLSYGAPKTTEYRVLPPSNAPE